MQEADEGFKQVLAQHPLFLTLSSEELDEVAQDVRCCSADKGQFFFHKGDCLSSFFIVLSGQVKLLLCSPEGDEKVVEIIGPRGSFGEAMMFLGRPYPVSAMALLDARCLQIRRETVDRLIQRDPDFASRMLGGLSMRLRSLIQDVESYSIQSGVQRVIGYLMQLCPDEAEGLVEIALPTTKFVIASRLNLTPETLSRVFHDLTEEGLIQVQGRRIIIPALDDLRAFMG